MYITRTKSSGLVTSDTAVLAQSGRLMYVVLLSDRTNDAEVVIYDNATTGSGDVLFKALLPGTDDSRTYNLSGLDLNCSFGLFADLTGTGAECILYFE